MTRELTDADANGPHKALLLDKERLAWLKEHRGLTKATIKRARLGWDGERYTIPIRDLDGALVNIRRYKPNASTNKMVSWATGYGSPARWYWPFGLDATAGTVLVTEGELDAVLAAQEFRKAGLGVCVASGTGGAKSPPPDLDPMRGRDVVIAYDNDDAGGIGARKLGNKLIGVAGSVKVVRFTYLLGYGEDVTDWFVTHGWTAQKLVEEWEDEDEWYGDTPKTAHQPSTEPPAARAVGPRRDADELVEIAVTRKCDEEGSRNAAGLWLACQLRDEGYTKAEAKPVMLDFRERVTGLKPKPYTEDEMRATIASAYSQPPREAVGAGARPAFDANARTGWSTDIDIEPALRGDPPPDPQICRWAGDHGTRALFYPNEVHSVFGEPESGKSWLLLHACRQEMARDNAVVFLDMEANDRSVVARLRSLGATTEVIRKFFHYRRPSEPITDADHAAIAEWVLSIRPTLVVLDGVTEGLAIHSLSSNSPEDIASWFLNVARRFIVDAVSSYPGPAIVELDHVVKDKDARSGWAIGSGHKKAGIKGAAYQVQQVTPFGKGRHGMSRILLEKDSPGGVVWVPYGKDRRRLVAEFHCHSGDDGSVVVGLESPVDEPVEVAVEVPKVQTVEFRKLMQDVWTFVEEQPSCSLRMVRTNVTGSAENVAAALDELLNAEYVRNEGNERIRKYVALKKYDPFRADLRTVPETREAPQGKVRK